MENQQDLLKKIKSLQSIGCEFKESHNDDHLTLICTDERCKPKNIYLQPMCSLCTEENTHQFPNHKENNLRVFLKNLLDKNQNEKDQNSFENQNKEKKTQIMEDLKAMKKSLMMAQDNIHEIVRQINLNLIDLDKLFAINVFKQITSIANSADYENLKKNLQQLDDQLLINQSQQQQKKYDIQAKNKNQKEIDNIQKLVNTFKDKFTDIFQKTLEYQHKIEGKIIVNPNILISNNIIVNNKKPYTGNLSQQLKHNDIQFRDIKRNQIYNNYYFNTYPIILGDRPLESRININNNQQLQQQQQQQQLQQLQFQQQDQQQQLKQHSQKFGIKIIKTGVFNVFTFGIISRQKAESFNFDIHNLPSQLGHSIYGIRSNKRVYCSNDEQINGKKLCPFGFHVEGVVVVCEYCYSEGFVKFSSSQDQFQSKYSIKFDQNNNNNNNSNNNNNNSQLDYHPFVALYNSEVLFLNEEDLKQYM